MSAEERNLANEGSASAPHTESPPGDGKAVARPAIGAGTAGAGALRGSRRRLVVGVIAILVVAILLYFGWPTVSKILSTVSTDDAYVNSHVTFVAARVPGQVTTVYVDDNDRVHKGSILVRLDKEPYQIQVDLKKAAFATAEAQLLATQDSVRGLVAQVRANRFKLQHAIESVDNQIALLRANIAALETKRATLTRAKADYDRAIELGEDARERSPRRTSIKGARLSTSRRHKSRQALEAVYEIRVGLGLPAKPEKGTDLAAGTARAGSELFHRPAGAGGFDGERGAARRLSAVV